MQDGEASRIRRVRRQRHLPIEEAQIDDLDPNLVTRQKNSVLVAAVATQDSQGRLHGLRVEGPAIPDRELEHFRSLRRIEKTADLLGFPIRPGKYHDNGLAVAERGGFSARSAFGKDPILDRDIYTLLQFVDEILVRKEPLCQQVAEPLQLGLNDRGPVHQALDPLVIDAGWRAVAAAELQRGPFQTGFLVCLAGGRCRSLGTCSPFYGFELNARL